MMKISFEEARLIRGNMKICIIADATVIHTTRYVEYILNQGHEIHLLTYKPPTKQIDGVDIHIVGSLFNNLYLAFPFRHFKIMRIIKKIKPDVVHAHFITKFGFHGALLGFHPLVVSAWGSDVLIIPNNSRLLWRFTKFSLEKADIIHAVSEYMAEEITSSFGISKSNIKICPFGIDTKRFNLEIDSSTSLIREQLGWERNPIIISARNFEPVYNIECLIDAIPLVIKEVPDTKFILLGKGTLETKLKRMVDKLDISNNVKFIEYVPNEELKQYFSCGSVYVSTSLSDSLGISNLEAMACGLPVILAEISITKELKRNGLVFDIYPPKDSTVLAKKIINAIENIEVADHKSNFAIITKEYNWEENMKEMENLYFELINSPVHNNIGGKNEVTIHWPSQQK
ncbi:glycosyltransferase family 4 protein [Methanolobus sp. WCC5]|uniref:glycosyltransferase family 4 protein n=1 Tax=Methanolobus sp. WCC5 TaxID=3125785 RepID=UPI0032506E59